jgi:hypothetical protein
LQKLIHALLCTAVKCCVSCASFSDLGDVVVNVLATGPKGCGFESSQGDGFLRAIKICSTPSSWMGIKAGRSHIVRFYGM